MMEFLSENSVAEFFDTSRSTIKRWVEKGVLPKPDEIGGVKRWHIDGLRNAVRTGLEEAAATSRRSLDPDEITARLLRDGSNQKNRKAPTRGRNG